MAASSRCETRVKNTPPRESAYPCPPAQTTITCCAAIDPHYRPVSHKKRRNKNQESNGPLKSPERDSRDTSRTSKNRRMPFGKFRGRRANGKSRRSHFFRRAEQNTLRKKGMETEARDGGGRACARPLPTPPLSIPSLYSSVCRAQCFKLLARILRWVVWFYVGPWERAGLAWAVPGI